MILVLCFALVEAWKPGSRVVPFCHMLTCCSHG
jgi:hypothetical protein